MNHRRFDTTSHPPASLGILGHLPREVRDLIYAFAVFVDPTERGRERRPLRVAAHGLWKLSTAQLIARAVETRKRDVCEETARAVGVHGCCCRDGGDGGSTGGEVLFVGGLGLFLVSRQAYAEAYPVFWATNTFTLLPTAAPLTPSRAMSNTAASSTQITFHTTSHPNNTVPYDISSIEAETIQHTIPRSSLMVASILSDENTTTTTSISAQIPTPTPTPSRYNLTLLLNSPSTTSKAYRTSPNIHSSTAIELGPAFLHMLPYTRHIILEGRLAVYRSYGDYLATKADPIPVDLVGCLIEAIRRIGSDGVVDGDRQDDNLIECAPVLHSLHVRYVPVPVVDSVLEMLLRMMAMTISGVRDSVRVEIGDQGMALVRDQKLARRSVEILVMAFKRPRGAEIVRGFEAEKLVIWE